MSFFRSKFVRSRRGLLTLCAALVLVLFLVRPEVNRLRARLVSSISEALGRPVEVSSVRLQLLPQPGFGLENFVVHDDPAFGAEPILRAQSVTAVLRVTSLLRGHLEISRLALSEPSLNLVRNSEGHWNLENLVERAAKIPVAPTSKAKTESRPGFPYIEASDGRINFKLGQEKKAFTLTNADFSLWQESENAWGVRLKAEPTRTDFNVTDTGILRVEGTWQRAGSLRETPVQFSAQWERAQLGQFTRLFTGNDKGWRGMVLVSVQITGKPADLMVSSNASIEDFRRYDIVGGEPVRLAGQCDAHYSSVDRQVSRLACRAPVSSGMLSLDGSIGGFPNPQVYDLSFSAREVPVLALLALVRNAKKDLPDDLVAAGKLGANFTLKRSPNAPQKVTWDGKGQITGFRVLARSTNTDLIVDRLPFSLEGGGDREAGGPQVDIGPVPLAAGGTKPATAAGKISCAGYSFGLQGDVRVKRLLQMARTVGVPGAQPAADGTAKVDLQVAGAWAGFPAPIVQGKAQLKSVHAEISELNAPLEIASADLVFRADEIAAQKIAAVVAGSTWTGSLLVPRRCPDPEACAVQFDFRTKELAGEKLAEFFNFKPRQQPWYRFLSTAQASQSYWARLRAEGKISVDRLLVRKLAFNQITAGVEVDRGRIGLSNLTAEVFGGRHGGDWSVDFTSNPPQYKAKGWLRRVALGQLAQSMGDPWITGTGSATYQASAAGAQADDFLSSFRADFEVEARDATLHHLVLTPNAEPLHAQRFGGRLFFRDGQLEVRDGKLETISGIYQISGTASRGRNLNLRLSQSGLRGYAITGTLAEPRVAPAGAPEARAALKDQ